MPAKPTDQILLPWDCVSETLLPHMSFVMSNVYPYQTLYYDYIKKTLTFTNDQLPSGSRVEGLSLVPTIDNIDIDLPDIDIMYPFKDIVCGEREHDLTQSFHFYLEVNDVHPGYVLLAVPDDDPLDDPHCLKQTLPNRDKHYLDSRNHQTALTQSMRKGKLTGPAVNAMVARGTDGDLVCALAVPVWPTIAKEWVTRSRPSNWPPADVIRAVVEEGCHVVPVSHVTSTTLGAEWRFSFSVAEITLSKHLSIIQKKCYLLLKRLHLQQFKEPRGIVSYHLKMVLFWAAEERDQELWTEQSMAHMLLFLLDKLLLFLIDKNLPSYFIPTNNLIDTIPVDALNTIKRKVAMVRRSPLRKLLATKHTSAIEGFNTCDMFESVVNHAECGSHVTCPIVGCFIKCFYDVSIDFLCRYFCSSILMRDQTMQMANPKDEAKGTSQTGEPKESGTVHHVDNQDNDDRKGDGSVSQRKGGIRGEKLKGSDGHCSQENEDELGVTRDMFMLTAMDAAIDIMVYCSRLIYPNTHPAIYCENQLLSLAMLPPYSSQKYDDCIVRICDRILERFPNAPNRMQFLLEIISRIATID